MKLASVVSLLLLCSFTSSFPAPTAKDDKSDAESTTTVKVKQTDLVISDCSTSTGGGASSHPHTGGQSQNPKPSQNPDSSGKPKPSGSDGPSQTRNAELSKNPKPSQTPKPAQNSGSSKNPKPSQTSDSSSKSPKPSSSDSSKSDKHSKTATPTMRFSATGAWTTKACTDKRTNTNIDPKKRWEEAGGNDAWEAAVNAWNHFRDSLSEGKRNGASFTKWLFNAFKYTDGLDCSNVVDSSCEQFLDQTDCHTPFAGYLVSEAVVGVHKPLMEAYNAFTDAWMTPASQIKELEKTFMPSSQIDTKLMKNLLADLGLLFSALAPALTLEAPIIGIAIAAVGTYATVASKDTIKDDPDPTDDLQNAVKQYTIGFKRRLSGFTSFIFRMNNQTTQDALTSLVKDGKSLGPVSTFQKQDHQKEVDLAIKMMWGKLVQYAWQWDTKDNYQPTILYVSKDDYQCGNKLPKGGKTAQSDLGSWMKQSTADNSCYKDENGDSWFFFNSVTPLDCTGATHCSNPGPQEILIPFPGWGDFVGNEKWGGITLEDIVLSSYGGFLANGRRNDYQLSDKDSKVLQPDMKTFKDYLYAMGGDVRTAGYWNATVCLDAQDVKDNIFANKKPCGVRPKSSQPVNGGYTDGWCTLHVEEYRRAYKGNALDSNQFKVTVKDDLSREIGSSDWKNAEPVVEVDSNLPHPIYVGDTSSDDDHIKFWYNDEYWMSNSDSHQCSFGPYDENGYSKGDCGFKCPKKEDSPKKDPPTPVPSHLPHGEYKSGLCGIHVHTTMETIMSVGNVNYIFTVDLYLKDGKQNLIKQTFGIKDKTAKIQGPLPHPLEVTPGKWDTSFNYNGDIWKASDNSRCGFDGKWDGHGKTQQQDMDCGFSC